jgi:hypothetical protein
MNTFKFSMYDLGLSKNREIYGTDEPPIIDMTEN